MKKVFYILIIIFAFNSCKLFNADINAFLEYYSGTSAVADVSFPETSGRASNGLLCIDSKADKTFNLILRNPQGYSTAGDITLEYKFNNEYLQNDISFSPDIELNDDLITATMTFSKENLEAFDKGNIKDDDNNIIKDLSGVCRIYADFSGSYFDGDYPVDFIVNSAPDRIRGAMFQINDKKDTIPNYVVAFNAPKITGTVHEADTHHLYIGKNHWTFTGNYNLTEVSVEPGCSLSTTKPSSLYDLDDKNSTFQSLSSDGYVPLYFTSNEKCDDSARVVTYKLSIVDDYGLSSNTVVINKPNKLQPPVFSSLTDASTYPAEEESGEFKFVINHYGDTFYLDEDGNERPGATCQNPVMIDYVVKRSGTVIESGVKRAPVILNLPSDTKYSVEAYAYSDGVIDSVKNTSKTFGVSRSNIYYVSQNGDDINGTGSRAKPYETIEQCFNEIQNQILSFGKNSSYVINLMSDISAQGDATFYIPPYNESDYSYIENSTVTVQGYGGVRKIRNIEVTGEEREAYSAISVVHVPAMTLKLKNLEITSEYGAGIEVNSTNAVNIELENVSVKDCYIDDSSAGIYFNTQGKLTLSNCTVINNTCKFSRTDSGKGAGIFVNQGSIAVKNKVVIKDNIWIDSDNNRHPSNLYLTKNGDNQRVIQIEGPLTKGSEIHLNTQTVPTVDVPVKFTQDFVAKNSSLKPYNVFFSDENYAVRLKDNEAVLAKGGLSIGEPSSTSVVLSSESLTTFSLKTSGNTITFVAKLNDQFNITSEVNWSFKLVMNGDDLSSFIKQGNTSQTKNVVTFINTNNLVAGKYNLYAFAKYKDKQYSTMVDVIFTE